MAKWKYQTEDERFIEFTDRSLNLFKVNFNPKRSDFKNKHTKVSMNCPIHGEYLQTPQAHLQSSCGCPQCGKLANVKKGIINKKKTTKQFIWQAQAVHYYFYKYNPAT